MKGSLIDKILNNGVKADTAHDLRSKLRIFNAAIVVCFIINFFYGIVGYINNYAMAVSVTFVLLGLCALSYYLTGKCKYNLAFHITLWLTLLFLSAMTYLFGGANSAYYFFMFVPVAAVIVFDNLLMTLFYFLVSSGILLLNIYFVKHYTPYYGIVDWMANFSYLNVFLASMMIYMGVRMFKSNNIKYSRTIENQNRSLEEKQKEILDSIRYAKRIQNSLLATEWYIEKTITRLKQKD